MTEFRTRSPPPLLLLASSLPSPPLSAPPLSSFPLPSSDLLVSLAHVGLERRHCRDAQGERAGGQRGAGSEGARHVSRSCARAAQGADSHLSCTSDLVKEEERKGKLCRDDTKNERDSIQYTEPESPSPSPRLPAPPCCCGDGVRLSESGFRVPDSGPGGAARGPGSPTPGPGRERAMRDPKGLPLSSQLPQTWTSGSGPESQYQASSLLTVTGARCRSCTRPAGRIHGFNVW
eukprot:768060-Hanusia_phi.AAC.4